jgi:anti-sigma factor RsiW
MEGEPEANHAIAAWVDGRLTPAQRQEFEAHLLTCAECQEQAAVLLKARLPARAPRPPVRIESPPQTPPPKSPARRWIVALLAALLLATGYFLGHWVWHLAHR